MKKSLFLGISIILSSIFYSSALIAETLFKINDQPTSVEEFKYVYQKNNINGQADFSKQSIEDYLQLFINYKLKVQQAKDLGLDTIPELMSEYEGYRRQLLDTHLKKEIDEPLMKQEYERSKSDVAISHVFIDKKSPKAADRINEALVKLKKGEDFSSVAKKYSADSLSAKMGGKIGYFTALQIGFPQIEDAMYLTPVGQFSDIVETDLGYHILKVDDIRPARGRIKVAIIKIDIPKDIQLKNASQQKMDSIYQLLMKGEDFSSLAVKYSEDVNSSMKGGELDWFGINTYVKEFEDVAFALKNNGEISKPFETSNSWYIIKKLSEVKSQTYQESEQVLQAKIRRSKFYNHKLEQFFESLKVKTDFKEYEDNIEKFEKNLEPILEEKPFGYKTKEAPYPLFQISGKDVTQMDVLNSIEKNLPAVSTKFGHDKTHALIDLVFNEYLLNAYEQHLKDSLPDYKSLLEEYENGVLIFELTKNKVWNKASTDTVGLEKFYSKIEEDYKWLSGLPLTAVITTESKTGDKYIWNPRAEVVRIKSTSNPMTERSLARLIKKNKLNTADQWKTYLDKYPNDGLEINIEMIAKDVTESSNQINWVKGVHTGADGQLYQVIDIVPTQMKKLSEARGYVVASYQEHLEQEWLKELHEDYKVVIDTTVVEKLIK